MITKLDLPDHWRSQLEGSEWVQQTNGESGAVVFRIETPGQPALYLKSEKAGPFEEIPAEAARLRWLAAVGISCPTVRRAETWDGRNWLLMTALRGADCESLGSRHAETIVAWTAKGLRPLHAIDIKSCPFDQTLAKRIADARERVLASAVDESNFDDEHVGMAPTDLFEMLTTSSPESEDLVVAHGDACLPNIMIDGEEFSGFV